MDESNLLAAEERLDSRTPEVIVPPVHPLHGINFGSQPSPVAASTPVLPPTSTSINVTSSLASHAPNSQPTSTSSAEQQPVRVVAPQAHKPAVIRPTARVLSSAGVPIPPQPGSSSAPGAASSTVTSASSASAAYAQDANRIQFITDASVNWNDMLAELGVPPNHAALAQYLTMDPTVLEDHAALLDDYAYRLSRFENEELVKAKALNILQNPQSGAATPQN
jgi:hypothetical protein